MINIDAVVSGLNVETISLKQAEPFPNAIDKENVIDIFFGGEANVLENNLDQCIDIGPGMMEILYIAVAVIIIWIGLKQRIHYE